MRRITFLPALLALLNINPVRAIEAPRFVPFQGRLTDAAGAPVPDGPRLVLFQIFGEPTGAVPLWAGESHRVTVNGGLVNVILGSKNPLPNDRPDDASRSFFDATLYLQITVDANGDGKFTDADPPLLPRQAIVPVVFAAEAGNARKLNGDDWTALFGNQAPKTGFLLPSKIQDGSLSGAKLLAHSVSGLEIAPGAVGTAELASPSVGSGNLEDGAVQTRHLASGAVAWDRLSPRTTNSTPEAGRIAISESCVDFQANLTILNEAAGVEIPNLSVTLKTTGRPVHVLLMSDGTVSDATTPAGCIAFDGPGNSQGLGEVLFLRGGIPISQARAALTTAQTDNNVTLYLPAASFQYLDVPAEGVQTYTVRVRGTRNARIRVYRVKLAAFEL